MTDSDDAAVAKMVTSLAASMGLAIIAEGVENKAQRALLAKQGCLAYQGYLFNAVPAPPSAIWPTTSGDCCVARHMMLEWGRRPRY